MQLNLTLLRSCLDDIKSKVSGVKSDLGLGNAVNHAITVLHDFETRYSAALALMVAPDSVWPEEVLGAFPHRGVLLPFVLGLHANKPNLSVMCLAGLHHVLSQRVVPPAMVFDAVFQSSKASEISGKAATWVIVEALIVGLQVPEHAVQQKALDCLLQINLDLRLDVSGQLLEQVLRSSFNLHLTSTNTSVKMKAASALQQIIRERIVALATASCGRGGRNAAFPPHHIFRVPPLPLTQSEQLAEAQEEDPEDFRSLPIPVVTTHLWHPAFEHLLRDTHLVLLTLLSLAVKPIPTTVNDVSAIEVRSRVFALDLVNHTFASFDAAHTSKQHRAILPDIVGRLRLEVWRCIARNLCYSLPFALFDGGVTLLTHVATKCHHLHQDDIRWFHDLVVAPILKSRFSTIDIKLRLVQFYRSVFSCPSLIITYWINYDAISCAFDSGLVTSMMRSVVDTMAIDFTVDQCSSAASASRSPSGGGTGNKGGGGGAAKASAAGGEKSKATGKAGGVGDTTWAADAAVVLSPDQAALLRFECAAALNDALHVMMNWISEDEEPFDDPDVGGSPLLEGPPQVDSAAAQPATHHEGPKYSWWYIHQLNTNRNIVNEARSKFALSWRDGLSFLKDRCVIDGSAKSFAEFVRKTPRMDRSQLCAIFERVLKEAFCMDFVKAYFATFDYAHMTLDVALRDTTLEFMSFERPVFEAQVWESIMHHFGVEYAAQNPTLITASDADALASVILFLHTNLHNPKNTDKMSADDFTRYGSECMAHALPPDDMRAMYNRVAAAMWSKRRDPVSDLQAYISDNAKRFPTLEPRREAMLTSTELAGNMATYAENFSHLTKNQQNALILMQYATECVDRFNEAIKGSQLARFVAVQGTSVEGAANTQTVLATTSSLSGVASATAAGSKKVAPRVALPAFCVPYYAQHVRPMLVSLYPYLATAAYLAGRLADNQRHVRLTQQMFARLGDLCVAFALPQASLQARAAAVMHESLRQDMGVDLGPVDLNLLVYSLHRSG